MKIIVLSSHTPSLCRFRLEMMREFVALGHEVVAVGNEDENLWGLNFETYGIKYRKVKIARNGTNPLKDLCTLNSLKKLFKEEKPDKIFTYQAKSIIYGGIAAKKLKDVEVYPLIAGIGSVFLLNSLKVKIVRMILKIEYRIALKRSKKVFFQNSDDSAVFILNKLVDESKIVMLHGSGVDLEKFTIQPLPDNFAFLCISRLIRDKGVCEYLDAAREVKKKYPQVRFLLVGPFDTNPSSLSFEELKPYIDDGVIEYFGEQSDVRPYLAQCNVFVLPSYREGTPKTVLEAMASFKAIITTDAPGCRETVINNENGFLVPVKDVRALINKMCELIEAPQRVEKMAIAGEKWLKKNLMLKK